MLRVAPVLFLSVATGFLAALALTRAMMRVAPRLGYLDHPSARKAHSAPTPLLGGVAIFLAFFAAVALAYLLLPPDQNQTLYPQPFSLVLIASLGTLILGLCDDRMILAPLPKLFWSCLISLVPALFLHATGAPFIECVALAAALLFFSHAFNLLDNSDGQCASVAAAAFAAAAVHEPLAARLAALGALLGFLRWNRPPARIFLGDAGSLLIGAWCVLLILRDPAHEGFQINPRLLPALWVPLYDTLSVIALRLWQRRPIWQGGQDHLAWRLMRLGLTPMTVNLVLAAATFIPTVLTQFLTLSVVWVLVPCLLLTAMAAELAALSYSVTRSASSRVDNSPAPQIKL